MQRHLSAVGLATFLAALFAVACVPQYKPPTENEPHAVLKFRRTYEKTPGASLREIVDLDDHRAYQETSQSATASAPRTDAILAHPVPVRAHFGAAFFHMERRLVQEQYTESEMHMETESYSCGSGSSYRTCTRSVMRSHPVYKTRMVTKNVEVADGACSSDAQFGPQVGHVYLLDYTYRDNQACEVRCYEQIPTGNPGEFKNESCPTVLMPN